MTILNHQCNRNCIDGTSIVNINDPSQLGKKPKTQVVAGCYWCSMKFGPSIEHHQEVQTIRCHWGEPSNKTAISSDSGFARFDEALPITS
ncbi:hypothetical protein PUNSTDRAFT_54552 [Punctularia strigosozonata HHB-11173 SS5]|uniref:uncharacterized protein n=1 Tax=Punctularia strigosozonata (strain HHB-11173) TaxID=741275 RepID=UPI0004416C35|nr:uncharacterized protein PUNSTDRAFT_54552 [Punctularia strigosozonata HHB-11173 SS5]EIN06330.1 hypothetical protein PUNSTDRAFT_54552 [Punctularia strigosozonata HHB-11173 SS5]